MKSPREYFYIFYTVSIMKSTGMRIKPKREYFFMLFWTQNSVCFERSLGLKRCDENFSSDSERENLKLAARPQWRIPGCSARSPLLPRNLGITNRGAIYSLSLCWRAHVCYRTPDSILTLVIRSSYSQLVCYRRPLPANSPWKHLVLRS